MAEDKKPDIQEDWDKLPLESDAADDWDDIPPPATEKAPAAATSTALEKVSPAEDYFEAQSDRNKNSADENNGGDQPSAAPADSAAEPGPEDEPGASAPEAPSDEDDFDAETADDFEVLADDDDDFDAPDSAPALVPSEGAAPAAADDEEPIPMPHIAEAKPPTKKVELDIEGMNFKTDEPPPPEPEKPAAPAKPEKQEKEPPKEAPPPAAEPAPAAPGRRKIAKRKLLLIAVPAVILLVGGLIFAIFMSDPEPQVLPPPPPVISPDLPPREAAPGEMRLESFYISFPGRSNDTIIEVSLILHYNDSPDVLLIREKMTSLRDIIYRVTQGKGSLLITDSELQRVLREELRERANLLLGGDYISYVQIDQIRILQ